MISAVELKKNTISRFTEFGIPEPVADTEWLMRELLGISRSDLIIDSEKSVNDEDEAKFNEAVDKRLKRIPVQYICGYQDFCGFRFDVNESTLIPRYDTETLVEEVLKDINCGDRVLDMCTGSGCILLSILGLSYETTGVGCDISEKAVETAKGNIKNVPGTEGRASFITGNLFENVPNEKFQIIVSNPPYVTEEEYEGLEPEVKEYEPVSALVAVDNGLWFYREISAMAKNYLEPGGKIYFEIGCSQGSAVSAILYENGFSDCTVIKDLAGLDRVVCGRLPIDI